MGEICWRVASGGIYGIRLRQPITNFNKQKIQKMNDAEFPSRGGKACVKMPAAKARQRIARLSKDPKPSHADERDGDGPGGIQ